MFRAARLVMRYSSFSDIWKIPYVIFGETKTLVWPYIVSGRRVAGTRYTLVPAGSFSDSTLDAASDQDLTLHLRAVYSWTSSPSSGWRSWSKQGWPSF